MTREVRPASPDPALRHGLQGRGSSAEEKRALHQGQKGLKALSLSRPDICQHPFSFVCQLHRPLTPAAGPYLSQISILSVKSGNWVSVIHWLTDSRSCTCALRIIQLNPSGAANKA
jgi:hypothetical protein